MQLRQKRKSSFNVKKEPEETPLPQSSTANTNASKDDNSPEAAPPPKKRMTFEAPVPVAEVKQPKPVKKQPMNVLTQMQDFAKTMKNQINQFKKEIGRIQKHGQGTNNFIIANELTEEMKEASENMSSVNALVPTRVNIQPIRKRIQLTVKSCPELFTKDKFTVKSTSIELIGFKWFMVATTREKGFLGLYLFAKPPNDFNGNYRVEVDYQISILNASFADKDLVEEPIEQVYTLDDNHLSGCGWGCAMAKFEDLLDPNKTFLTPEGDLETWVDFTIKSATPNY